MLSGSELKSDAVPVLPITSACLSNLFLKPKLVDDKIYLGCNVAALLTLQMVTCNMCGCGKVLDAVFTVIAAAWWLVAGFITASHTRAANNAKLRQAQWRNAVVLLCWITSGLFALLFMVHMGRIGVSCCRRRRKAAAADIEKAELNGRDRTPSAAVELGKEVANRPYMLGRGAKPSKDQPAAYLGGPNI